MAQVEEAKLDQTLEERSAAIAELTAGLSLDQLLELVNIFGEEAKARLRDRRSKQNMRWM